ncbi:2-succinyl-5-enolpyruvyl-6-hydroxy-3-cyclohexene-1-carboxylic-acid synthase [Accumulibacter sp.]|uniref:2-succinyl-5-enolpyruvyl-6-hydroxy-3- cyclohexene-1-carboxylic-acid synthase n=1 Tax=Accumulibacter sp. TaxID=2053492 RepID=UPI0028C4354D|nr:2-succinyl-5-enolpyruvyl-6-hydroxy-3-cyclohexene-1-carboxylic-acid synthase [Accumulibacter sp.]
MKESVDTGLLNLRWSQALVDALAAAGLRELVLSPGSRSSPLALAFLRQPAIRCHVLVDERSAAFFALGIAKASGRPSAVLCTSGSAPANWFPAVIEADLGAVPLLLLSADRPPELLGWGANQTIDQQRLFGSHVRSFHAPALPGADVPAGYLRQLATRAMSECCWPLPGPVHLNLAFREPLLPAGSALPEQGITISTPANCPVIPRLLPDRRLIEATLADISGRPGVIVCGGGDYPQGFADALTALASQLDCPIFAEPLSNLRFGSHDRSRLCVRYEAYLRHSSPLAVARPDWLLRFGAFPVTRSLQNWLRTAAAESQILISPDSRWPDPQHRASRRIQADPALACEALLAGALRPAPPSWRAGFAQAEAQVEAIARSCRPQENFEGALIPTLIECLPAGHRLFCGNSLAIRDLDAFSGSSDKPLRLFGNRGASGIDGNLSTALGIATQGACVALVGDLTAQHDLTALAAVSGCDIVFVVLNNGGGGIFDYLPVASLPEFERAWLTPQAIDLSAAARSFGVSGQRVGSLAEFRVSVEQALVRGGATLIEVPIDRLASVARRQALWRAWAGGAV